MNSLSDWLTLFAEAACLMARRSNLSLFMLGQTGIELEPNSAQIAFKAELVALGLEKILS